MAKIAPGPFWCVSVNPAIDKRMRVKKLMRGAVNRVMEMRGEPGGKAAHVAMVLQMLGAEPVWVGFAGGSTGEQLRRGLKGIGVGVQSVAIEGETRVNLEIIDEEGVVTEILEPGSAVSEREVESFFELCKKLFSGNREPGVVIASGSVPPGVQGDFYARLTELAHRCGHKLFLDSSGEAMKQALQAEPDLIKPNREEAEWLVEGKIGDREAARSAVGKLVALGARGAMVSLGADGLVCRFADGRETFHAMAPKVSAKSTVGCGDATLAGLAYATLDGFEAEKSLQLAVACGAANCLADAPGQLRETDVRAFEVRVEIERLN